MSSPRLLLIEDSADDIALARRALARSRMKVDLQVARTGQEALTILGSPAAELPKAVFLDLNMPEWNGFDLLRKLRSQSHTRTVPVVILTTSREPGDVSRSYILGANSFVTKPVDFGEFTELFAQMTGYWLNINQAEQ
jgi:two-component system response regulator